MFSVLANVSVMVGCANNPADGTADEDFQNQASLQNVERGPLLRDEADSLSTKGSFVYRVESFGNMRINVQVESARRPPLLGVYGPVPVSEGDGGPIWRGIPRMAKGLSQGIRSSFDGELARPGLYFVVASNPDDAPFTVRSTCTQNCKRAGVPLKSVLEQMRAAGQLEALQTRAFAMIEQTFPSASLVASLKNELQAILAHQDFEGIERFPTIPIGVLGEVRSALGILDAQPEAAPEVINNNLVDLLGACTASRTLPAPSEEVPGLRFDHFANASLSTCQYARSTSFAKVLTSLAANNGSRVRYKDRDYTTPEDLLSELIKNGHRVELRAERTYANFLSFATDREDVIWPVWLNTGIEIPGSAGELTVPVGHSHFAWFVQGPDVDARVMFYLGPGTIAFYGQTRVRPTWTGLNVTHRTLCSSDLESQACSRAVQAIQLAGIYEQRILHERTTVAVGFPSGGYGLLGVCNDSAATIEMGVFGEANGFPLVRDKSLRTTSIRNDGLDSIFASLPADADEEPSLESMGPRILAMTPNEWKQGPFFDAQLQAQILALQAALNR